MSGLVNSFRSHFSGKCHYQNDERHVTTKQLQALKIEVKSFSPKKANVHHKHTMDEFKSMLNKHKDVLMRAKEQLTAQVSIKHHDKVDQGIVFKNTDKGRQFEDIMTRLDKFDKKLWKENAEKKLRMKLTGGVDEVLRNRVEQLAHKNAGSGLNINMSSDCISSRVVFVESRIFNYLV
ncbi:hypothetical protein HAX39_24770 [Citrobacter freundii]|nr:hypothetical protein [Citrobacter freundii]